MNMTYVMIFNKLLIMCQFIRKSISMFLLPILRIIHTHVYVKLQYIILWWFYGYKLLWCRINISKIKTYFYINVKDIYTVDLIDACICLVSIIIIMYVIYIKYIYKCRMLFYLCPEKVLGTSSVGKQSTILKQ